VFDKVRLGLGLGLGLGVRVRVRVKVRVRVSVRVRRGKALSTTCQYNQSCDEKSGPVHDSRRELIPQYLRDDDILG
jgi:hypothetical protein